MAKKKRMYYTSIKKEEYNLSSHGAIKSMMVKDVSNPLFYTWYDLTSAQFASNGTLSMRCSGTHWENEAEGVVMHWSGMRMFKPDDPEYAKFCEAVRMSKEELW